MRVEGQGFMVYGLCVFVCLCVCLWFRVYGLGFRVKDLYFSLVWGLMFRVEGVGFRV